MKRRRIPKEIRLIVFRKFGGACAYCGDPLTYGRMSVDHVRPIHRGGTNDFENLFPACRTCNNQKMTYTVGEFRAEIAAQAARIMRHGRVRIAVKTGAIAKTGNAPKFHFERWIEEVKRGERE